MPLNASKNSVQAKPWPVMVLAHNEERHIAACLDSIFAADTDKQFQIFVMANGCTDRTEAIVKEYSRTKPQVHLVSIALGDKCNAWNVFIHDTVPRHCDGRDIYFFMDGDAQVMPGSFTAMARALETHPHANAASAVPASGRNAEHDRREIMRDHGLVANLYSLRGVFVDRLRHMSIRIPLKLEGDDGLIGALIKWDLSPERQGFDLPRIVPCSDAAFRFESMSPARLQDWKLYWRRAVRYGRRRYEFQLLANVLKSRGVAALPLDITALYPNAKSLHLRWDGLSTVTNLIALRRMRSVGKSLGPKP